MFEATCAICGKSESREKPELTPGWAELRYHGKFEFVEIRRDGESDRQVLDTLLLVKSVVCPDCIPDTPIKLDGFPAGRRGVMERPPAPPEPPASDTTVVSRKDQKRVKRLHGPFGNAEK